MGRVTSGQIIAANSTKSGRPYTSPAPQRIATWSYGVMTVPSRRETLLPRTLESLVAAGFPSPRLFVDGGDSQQYASLGLPTTVRNPAVRVAGNWALGMAELYLHSPRSDAYVMFQDDVLVCRDLREYLELCKLPANSYLNLYTAWANQKRMQTQGHRHGWYTSNQSGYGALALLFTREALVTLLTSRYFVTRPQDDGGHKSVDGGIVTAMRAAGYKEYVHLPGLVQHTGGRDSTMGHVPARNWDAESRSFIGESTSALTLLR